MIDTVRCFIGYDPRQPIAYNVLQHSLHRNSMRRIQVEPLMLSKLPIKRRGLTEFTFSRFLVPWLCNYEGVAIFMDPDVAVVGDIGDLADQADDSAVQVMKEQAPFEWASVMVFKNALCTALTPEFVDDESNKLFDLAWGTSSSFLPEWNHCVGYAEPKEAKLYHFTQGLPLWYETEGLPEDEAWHHECAEMGKSVSWVELMGRSVHAKPVLKRMLLRYGLEVR